MDQGEVSPTLIDVFMEHQVFSAAQTRRILQAGSALGLQHNFHGDELSHSGAGQLAGELGSLAVSHLEQVRLLLLLVVF
jgi:imidazolonepropionase